CNPVVSQFLDIPHEQEQTDDCTPCTLLQRLVVSRVIEDAELYRPGKTLDGILHLHPYLLFIMDERKPEFRHGIIEYFVVQVSQFKRCHLKGLPHIELEAVGAEMLELAAVERLKTRHARIHLPAVQRLCGFC